MILLKLSDVFVIALSEKNIVEKKTYLMYSIFDSNSLSFFKVDKLDKSRRLTSERLSH